MGLTNFDGVAASAVSLTADTTLTSWDHAGRPLVLNKAAGLAVTLPKSTGSGAAYTLYVGTAVASNSTTIKVSNGTDIMAGVAWVATDNASDAVVAFETAADSDTITMDGSTQGGLVGHKVVLVDAKSGVWMVQASYSATGTEATPFSASVS